MIFAATPNRPHPDDWLTLDRGAIESAVPVSLLAEAIEAGDVPIKVTCGTFVVQRAEVQAWALSLRAEAREYVACEG